MTLTEIDGQAGAPWERPRAGTLERLVVRSDLLEGNPLGDPGGGSQFLNSTSTGHTGFSHRDPTAVRELVVAVDER